MPKYPVGTDLSVHTIVFCVALNDEPCCYVLIVEIKHFLCLIMDSCLKQVIMCVCLSVC